MNRNTIYIFTSLVILCTLFCETRERSVEGSVESHFSAQEGAEWVIEREIDNATKAIEVAVYAFTSRPLAQALVDAHNRGVKIRIIVEPSNASSAYSKATYLINNGIEVKTKRGAGLMHHKFAVIDDTVLITGSFNWTASAEADNDENILLLKGFPATCKSFQREFSRLWDESEPWCAKPQEPEELSATNLSKLRKHAGDEVVVYGRVVRVGHSDRSNTYFLDFAKDKKGFTVVIFSSVVAKYDILGISIPDYEGDSVEVTGELVDHPEYGLEIILDEPSQIRVLEAEQAPAEAD